MSDTVEVYKVFIESIKVFSPSEIEASVIEHYTGHDIVPARSSVDLRKGTPSYYIYKGMMLAESALSLSHMQFFKLKNGKYEKIIDDYYIEHRFNMLFKSRGREGESLVYCESRALHFVNHFKNTTFYNPTICDSPMLVYYQELVTFMLDIHNLTQMPRHTTAEWREFIDRKWPPQNYPDNNFSQTKKEALLAFLPKTRE